MKNLKEIIKSQDELTEVENKLNKIYAKLELEEKEERRKIIEKGGTLAELMKEEDEIEELCARKNAIEYEINEKWVKVGNRKRVVGVTLFVAFMIGIFTYFILN